MSTKVMINGQQFEASAISMPESGRLFRSAWDTPKNGVVRLDIEKVGEMCHDARRRWRDHQESQPFKYGSDTFDSDEKSLARIERISNMAAKGLTLPKSFTSASGKEVEVTAEWLDGLYVASIQHTVDVHEENKKRKDEIDKAVNAEDMKTLQSLFEEMKDVVGE